MSKKIFCYKCKYFVFPYDLSCHIIYREYCLKKKIFFPRLFNWHNDTKCEYYIKKNKEDLQKDLFDI